MCLEERTGFQDYTESFLLRRMNSGPAVKAALIKGTAARAVQMGVLENFMMLSRSMSLLWLSYTQKISLRRMPMRIQVAVQGGNVFFIS